LSESLKGRVADLAGDLAERLFTSGIRLSGSLARPAARLAPKGGQRVLVVAPHPDDEVAGCAAALLSHGAAGDELAILVATDGRQSRALGLAPEEMARRRRQEAGAAAEALSASLLWIGLPEGGWWDEELLAPLRDALVEFSPAVVYAPSRVDFHSEHLRVAAVLGRALLGEETLVRVYQVHVPLARSLVNVVVDAGAFAEPLEGLLRLYETQRPSLERTLRLRRYAAARHGLAGLAEEFFEMRSSRYAELHAGSPPEWAGVFRGMRHRSFTDPLAYARGWRARRSLLRGDAK
jgi:LmbE family N-acetylglucosaminyl deacetylase